MSNCVLVSPGRSILITNLGGDTRLNPYLLVFLIRKGQQLWKKIIDGRDVFKMELKYNTFKP
jgi:hypothetical protein